MVNLKAKQKFSKQEQHPESKWDVHIDRYHCKGAYRIYDIQHKYVILFV